jgi:hypothetical protein
MNIKSLSPSHTGPLPIVFHSMSVAMYALILPLSSMSPIFHFQLCQPHYTALAVSDQKINP